MILWSPSTGSPKTIREIQEASLTLIILVIVFYSLQESV